MRNIFIILVIIFSVCFSGCGDTVVSNENKNINDAVSDSNSDSAASNDNMLTVEDVLPPETDDPDTWNIYLEMKQYIQDIVDNIQLEPEKQNIIIGIYSNSVSRLEAGDNALDVQTKMVTDIEEILENINNNDQTNDSNSDIDNNIEIPEDTVQV